MNLTGEEMYKPNPRDVVAYYVCNNEWKYGQIVFMTDALWLTVFPRVYVLEMCKGAKTLDSLQLAPYTLHLTSYSKLKVMHIHTMNPINRIFPPPPNNMSEIARAK